MLKPRTLRRCLLTLAVSAAPGIAFNGTIVSASERFQTISLPQVSSMVPLKPVPVSEFSGRGPVAISQVQYQPPSQPPANASGTSVNQELNRLFQESGQQMPSMRSQDLPYANTPRTDLVRRRAEIPPAETKKSGLLNRLFDRFRDDEPATSATTTMNAGTPPPIRMADGSLLQQRPAGSSAPTAVNQQPVYRNQTSNQARQTAPGIGYRPPNQPSQGQQPTPAAVTRNPLSSTAQRPATRSTTMQTTVAQPVAAQTQNRVKAPIPGHGPQSVSNPKPSAVQLRDEFIDPFTRQGFSDEPSMVLDLDSLIEDIPVDAAPLQIEQEPTLPAPEIAVDEQPVDAFAEEDFATNGADDAESVLNGNPFTGVRLETSRSAVAPTSKIDDSTTLQEARSNADQAADPFSEPTSDADPLPPVAKVLSPDNDLFQEPRPSIALPPATNAGRSTFNEKPLRTAADAADSKAENRVLVAPTQKTANAELLRQQQQQARRETQRNRLQTRRHLTGFKGFCPVALREQRDLIEASDEFTATFGLKTFLFSSAEAVTRFQSEPSRYAPAAGGSDVVLLVNTGEEKEGNLDYALWYRDRLYLFCSRDTMRLFDENPHKFANQY